MSEIIISIIIMSTTTEMLNKCKVPLQLSWETPEEQPMPEQVSKS